MSDRLDVLRAKYLDEITVKEQEIRKLRDKVTMIDELDADCQKLPESNTSGKLKYTGWKLTKAVLDAVQNIGQNGGVAATDVRKYITTYGYKHPNMKNFPVATVIALNRLFEQGQIQSTKIGSKRTFKAKDISEYK